MPERHASWTAIYTAIFRAAHQLLDATPKILDDPVAVGLVEGASEADIRAQAADFQQPLQRLARSLFVVRSRFAEDQLAEAVKAGVGQYVVLGQGWTPLPTVSLHGRTRCGSLRSIIRPLKHASAIICSRRVWPFPRTSPSVPLILNGRRCGRGWDCRV